jgi:hypothetical protein
MMKPYVSGESIAVDFVQADQFFPLAFDANGDMTAYVFADCKTAGQSIFTRLETHAITGEGYQISNRAFRSTAWDALGHEAPLASVPAWAALEEKALVVNISRPLYAYFRMPFPNNIDPASSLGVSCYARVADLIEQADRQWSELLWEFELAHAGISRLYQTHARGSPGLVVARGLWDRCGCCGLVWECGLSDAGVEDDSQEGVAGKVRAKAFTTKATKEHKGKCKTTPSALAGTSPKYDQLKFR